jgi:cysteine synthase A
MIHDSILGTIGNTPVVRVNRIGPKNATIYVKCEAFNPLASVKDRLAIAIIEDAERRGTIKPGQTVIEATSGNTGIALAMVCAAKGYPFVAVMADSFSIERRKLMRILGAKVILTPAAERGSGMVKKAEELAKKHGWFLARQFENLANPEYHRNTTGPEILRDFAGKRLDYWVTGYGTGGTLKGVGRVLREQSPATRIIVCEPDNSPVLGSGIRQERRPDGSAKDSHPLFRPHLMQGWSPDFIPRLTEDAVDAGYCDRILPIAGDDALRLARDLARREGIFVGISAGATMAGALAVAADAPPGANILCMLPDTGERYLSTPLFDGIDVDMNDAELEISRSTPSARFDVCGVPAPIVDDVPPAASEAGRRYFADAIADAEHPVVLFALEWCEFCWSVRKLMAAYGIPYRSVDLDSVPFQQDNLGGEIRNAIRELTGLRTIPQVFIGGTHVGGATEFFDALRDGRAQSLLEESGVEWNRDANADPYSYLPRWLHARH